MSAAAAGTALYFAYGSNMCTGNLRQVAPSAAPIGVARLPRHELQFRKRSSPEDGAGSNPFETGREESVVWGVLFRMSEADLQALVRLEDGRYGYVPTPKTVYLRGSGEAVSALVFMSEPRDLDPNLRPSTGISAGSWRGRGSTICRPTTLPGGSWGSHGCAIRMTSGVPRASASAASRGAAPRRDRAT